MFKRYSIPSPLTTFFIYVFVGVAFFVIPGLLIPAVRILVYVGAAIILYAPIAALITKSIGKR